MVDHATSAVVTIGFDELHMVKNIHKIPFIMVPITVYDIRSIMTDNNTIKYVDPNYCYFSTLPTL